MNIRAIAKNQCTGCTACMTVCPMECIFMTADEEGFLYPDIYVEKCIECGKCLNKCPANKPVDLRTPLKALAATGKDATEVCNSSSGGAFYLCAKYVIEQLHGLVCGAVLNEDLSLQHEITDNMTGVTRMQGSKYIQSNLGGCLEEIAEYAAAGRKVLVCGTPCQIAAVNRVVKEGRDNLFTLDLICHGVPSAKKFSEYINSVYGCYPYDNFTIRQRNKYVLTSYSYSYKNKKSTDKQVCIDSFNDPFYQAFLDGHNYRESCYHCVYASPKRVGDITIGDCANTKACPSLMGRALSSMIINSAQGERLWKAIQSSVDYVDADYECETRLNKQLHIPVKRTDKRDEFYYDLKALPIEQLRKKYCPKRTAKERLKHFIIWHVPYKLRYKVIGVLRRN